MTNTTQRYENPLFHYGFYILLYSIGLATMLYHGLYHGNASGHASTAPKACTETKPVTIAVTGRGFTPDQLSLGVCAQVVFINQDTKPHQPTIGQHLNHDKNYSPDERLLQPGEQNTFTLDKPGEFVYHDHLYPTYEGKLTVD